MLAPHFKYMFKHRNWPEEQPRIFVAVHQNSNWFCCGTGLCRKLSAERQRKMTSTPITIGLGSGAAPRAGNP
jgi:hypothetical protein